MTEVVSNFFFEAQDPSSLALFRILIGLVVTASAISYARNALLVLDPNGLLPFQVWRSAPVQARFSILRYLPASRASVFAVIVAHGLSGLSLSAGFMTTAAAVAAFVTTISLHHRNTHVMHSGDALLRMMCFLLIFADSGAKWSVDAMLSGRETSSSSSWALRLMQLQLAALYLQTAWFKIKGQTWRSGTASHYASRLLGHRKRRLPPFADTPLAHRIATYATLMVESGGGTLVWFDSTRYIALAGLLGLHLTLQALMHMHLFQWTMLASLTLFIPGEDLATATNWIRSL